MIRLLSGNEAIALGAYHAGVRVATAYPGTPSTEILENFAQFKDVYAEWSTNEKVAMEVALGAAYTGTRALVSLKQVGLNVASDPFMAAATTGMTGGLVIVDADDPGVHSSQCEQDNRHYAKFARIPMLEPADSQEAYELMAYAFEISEQFDTPVMVRSTTRLSHTKSAVNINKERKDPGTARFTPDFCKFVMLPVNARIRWQLGEERMTKLSQYAETFPLNKIIWAKQKLGIITSGVAYEYAREVFPEASFLKLAMTNPLPVNLLRQFAAGVDKILVVEELSPYLEENIKALGIKVIGKEFVPTRGELNPGILFEAGVKAGMLSEKSKITTSLPKLPPRPPLLCPGCPHTGTFFVLSALSHRINTKTGKANTTPKFAITGDIGCYTLGAYPPHSAIDTTACMGASIGQALGMDKAGVAEKVVAVIGDSTFIHSGITGLINAVYDQGKITVIILDNGTTAMTGHQEHPGTGISVQGKPTQAVQIDKLVQAIGVKNFSVVDAFDIKELRTTIKKSIELPELSVILVRGSCVARTKRGWSRAVDAEKCTNCGTCLRLGCPAIQTGKDNTFIDPTLCMGDACNLCEQLCPKKAIGPLAKQEAA